jgi:hypothetical protein
VCPKSTRRDSRRPRGSYLQGLSECWEELLINIVNYVGHSFSSPFRKLGLREQKSLEPLKLRSWLGGFYSSTPCIARIKRSVQLTLD